LLGKLITYVGEQKCKSYPPDAGVKAYPLLRRIVKRMGKAGIKGRNTNSRNLVTVKQESMSSESKDMFEPSLFEMA
jgi:hypothetical protein